MHGCTLDAGRYTVLLDSNKGNNGLHLVGMGREPFRLMGLFSYLTPPLCPGAAAAADGDAETSAAASPDASCGGLPPAQHAGKTRLRWSPELHSQFVTAVTELGGAFSATPKAILRRMTIEGLTLFHVSLPAAGLRAVDSPNAPLPHDCRHMLVVCARTGLNQALLTWRPPVVSLSSFFLAS